MKKPTHEPKFSDREKAVWSLFWKAGFNRDIQIDAMYNAYNGIPVSCKVLAPSARQRHMSIGMVITIINRKLKGSKLVPGALKKTYRLIHLG